jgi:hypothetical protein
MSSTAMKQLVTMGISIAALVVAAACVTEKIRLKPGVGSFKVEIVSMDPLIRLPGCESAPDTGTKGCPRPFAELTAPLKVRIRATALDRGAQGREAQPLVDWQGSALIDVRPGQVAGVGPAGTTIKINAGVGEADIQIADAFGPSYVWVEDCGSTDEPGTFATGTSPAIWFDQPRIDQIQWTEDNTTSPLTPRPTNICAITGDPRYQVGLDADGVLGFQGYSHGKVVNAPPAAMGFFLEVIGCTRDEYDLKAATGGCGRGPLVVTAIGNEGFYITDTNSAAVARGFNHMYAFNFNYPDNLEVGDIVTSLRGSPVEFAGATQFSNPVWLTDGERRGHGLLPKAVKIAPAIYQNAMKTYGRNVATNLDMEMLESGLVCFENLAPASTLRLCDVNESGSIERQGCTLPNFGDPLPPVCEVGMGTAPMLPLCDASSTKPFCFPISQADLTACGLTGYVPDNVQEYCCERTCYNDPNCTEQSSYLVYGQWVADVYGRYELGPTDSAAVKIAVISRDANPDFDPMTFGAAERAKPEAERKRIRVIGNLRQVLAARPTWVVIPRTPADMEIGGTCPQ